MRIYHEASKKSVHRRDPILNPRAVHSEAGFGLMESLVAVAIMAIVGLAMATIFANMNNSLRSTRITQDRQLTNQGLNVALTNSEMCAETLGFPVINPGTFPANPMGLQVLRFGGETLADVNNPAKDIKTEGITLTMDRGPFPVVVDINPDPGPTGTTNVNMNRYFARLTIRQAKMMGGSTRVVNNVGGDQMQDQVFFLTLNANSAAHPTAPNRLHSCYGAQTDFSQHVCEAVMGGEFDPAQNPQCLIKRIGVLSNFVERGAKMNPAAGQSDEPGASLNTPGTLTVRNMRPNSISFWSDNHAADSLYYANAGGSWFGKCDGACGLSGAPLGADVLHLSGWQNNRMPLNGAPTTGTSRLLSLLDHVELPVGNARLWIGNGHDVPGGALNAGGQLHVRNGFVPDNAGAYYNNTPYGATGWNGYFDSTGGPAALAVSGISLLPIGSDSSIVIGRGNANSSSSSWNISHIRQDGGALDRSLGFFPQGSVTTNTGGAPPVLRLSANYDVGMPGRLVVGKDSSPGGNVTTNNILHVLGNMAATADIQSEGGSVYAGVSVQAPTVIGTSDARLKTDITPVKESVLEKIMKMHAVKFRWKTGPRSTVKAKQVGFLAQDIEELFPEAVLNTGKRDGLEDVKGLDFNALTAYLVEGVKELATKCESEHAILRAENEKLRQRVDQLEKRMNNMESAFARFEEQLRVEKDKN